MSDLGTVSVGHLRSLIAALERVGIDLAAVLRESGAALPDLSDPDARIDAQLAFGVFDHVASLTGDSAFGLHTAEALPRGAFGIIEYVTRSSHTVGEGLERLARFYALMNEHIKFELSVSRGAASFADRNPTPIRVPPQLSELLFAVLVFNGRSATGKDWPMRAVHFAHEAPRDISEHERIFKCPILFEQKMEAIVFDAAWLDEPLLTADPHLASMLDHHAQLLLAKLPRADGFLGDVRAAIAESLHGRDPSLDATAARLHSSARTVQRRLQELGTSHQALVEIVRRDLAQRYLASGEISIGEMAYMLGFARTSAFHRAFKRWTGTTPAEFKSRTPGARGKSFGVKRE